MRKRRRRKRGRNRVKERGGVGWRRVTERRRGRGRTGSCWEEKKKEEKGRRRKGGVRGGTRWQGEEGGIRNQEVPGRNYLVHKSTKDY